MLEDELKIDDLLNIAPYGLFIIGFSGQIIFASKMAATRLGKTAKEIIGTTLTDYFQVTSQKTKCLKA